MVTLVLLKMCLFLKEHYYDPQSGQGYLTWRIKNIQRNSASSEKCRRSSQSFRSFGGPTSEREAASSTDVILTEEQCREAVSLIKTHLRSEYHQDQNEGDISVPSQDDSRPEQKH